VRTKQQTTTRILPQYASGTNTACLYAGSPIVRCAAVTLVVQAVQLHVSYQLSAQVVQAVHPPSFYQLPIVYTVPPAGPNLFGMHTTCKLPQRRRHDGCSSQTYKRLAQIISVALSGATLQSPNVVAYGPAFERHMPQPSASPKTPHCDSITQRIEFLSPICMQCSDVVYLRMQINRVACQTVSLCDNIEHIVNLLAQPLPGNAAVLRPLTHTPNRRSSTAESAGNISRKQRYTLTMGQKLTAGEGQCPS
jgi:hypothetical protein